jgi:hypothetical protein
MQAPVPDEREHGRGFVARLGCQRRKIDRAAVEARRRAGLEPPRRQLQFPEPGAESLGRRIARAPCFVILQPHVNQTRQKRPGGQHDRGSLELESDLGHDTLYGVAF